MFPAPRTLAILLSLSLATTGAVLGLRLLSSGSASGEGTDYGLDVNGNGMYDWLVVEAQVDLPLAGMWDLSATLSASEPPVGGPCGPFGPVLLMEAAPVPGSAWPVAYATERYFFASGRQTVRLAFLGTDIYRAGVDGPYRVDLSMYLGGGPIVYGTDPIPALPGNGLMGPGAGPILWSRWTNAYTAMDFEEPYRPAYFSGGYHDAGVDLDRDGRFDFLELTADLRVNEAGVYHLSGALAFPVEKGEMSYNYTFAYAFRDLNLMPGEGKAVLRFRGDEIRAMAVDGPWSFSLTLFGPDTYGYAVNGTAPPDPTLGDPYEPSPVPPGIWPPRYPETLCGTTSAYAVSDFDEAPELVRFTNQFEEIPQDGDGNGLYDLLTIRAQVEAFVASGFMLRGDLLSADGSKDVANVESLSWLPEGMGWVEFPFPGPAIRATGIDGPYLAVLSIEPDAFGHDPTTTYVTRAYAATDFDAGPAGCNCTLRISDLNYTLRDTGLDLFVGVVRWDPTASGAIADILTVTAYDSSRATVWAAKASLTLPSTEPSVYVTFGIEGLVPGTYTIVAVLGPPDTPEDSRALMVTL